MDLPVDYTVSPSMSYLVDDSELNIRVPFDTLSDAKIAALVLQHRLPVYVVDLFIQIIISDNFHVEELTFKPGNSVLSQTSLYLPNTSEFASNSVTDQNFLAFVRNGNLSAPVVDSLLSLVCDAKFDLKQVTFGNAADILRQVTEHRLRPALEREQRERAKLPISVVQANWKFWQHLTNRSKRREGENPATTTRERYNLDVLEAILEQIVLEQHDEELRSLSSDQRVRECAQTKVRILRRTLKVMALVHRSWTIPALKAQGSVVRLLTASARRTLCNPLVGTSTKRAYLEYRCTDSSLRHEAVWMAETLYQRSANLRKLAIDFKLLERRDLPYARSIIEGVATLAHLEELLVNIDGARSLLLHVCRVISGLERVRKIGINFRLYRGQIWYNEFDVDEVAALGQLHCKIEDIQFTVEGRGLLDGLDFAVSIFRWLFNSGEGTVRVLNFSCDTEDRDVCMRFFAPISPFLDRLHSLELHTDIEFSASEASIQFYRSIIARCRALQNLRICVKGADDRSCRDAHYELMKYKPATLWDDNHSVKLSSNRIWIPTQEGNAHARHISDLDVGDCALKQHDYTLIGWDQRQAELKAMGRRVDWIDRNWNAEM